MKNRTLLTLLCLLLAAVLCFAGCGSQAEETQAPTAAPTEAPATEAPTEAPTEEPTEAPTEAPTVYTNALTGEVLEEAQTNAQTKTMDADQIILEEQERINCARQAAQNFIDLVEQDIKGHLELLDKLKTRDMKLEVKQPVQRQKPFDFEDGEKPLVVPKADTKPPEPAPSTEEIANEIEQNISRIMDIAEPVPQPAPKHTHTDSSTIKFTNLQFGSNYDPTR